MEKNKEKVIKELRRVFCAPCTTANSCVGCLVDIAEEAVIASQQSAHTDLLRADPRSAVAHPTSESTADNRRAKSATSG